MPRSSKGGREPVVVPVITTVEDAARYVAEHQDLWDAEQLLHDPEAARRGVLTAQTAMTSRLDALPANSVLRPGAKGRRIEVESQIRLLWRAAELLAAHH